MPDDEATGRAAGVACAASGTRDVVDAIVIATAARYQAAIVTSDPGGLARIAEAIGIKIRLTRSGNLRTLRVGAAPADSEAE